MTAPALVVRDAAHALWLTNQPALGTWVNPSAFPMNFLTERPNPDTDQPLAKPEIQSLSRSGDVRSYATTQEVRLPVTGYLDTVECIPLLAGVLGWDTVSGGPLYLHTFASAGLLAVATTIQPLISAMWTHGVYDTANDQWEVYRLLDGVVESFTINFPESGPIPFTAQVSGSLHLGTTGVSTALPTKAGNTGWTPAGAIDFRPRGICFEEAMLVFKRATVALAPVLAGSSITFTQDAPPQFGSQAVAGSGPIRSKRHGEGKVRGAFEVDYDSRSDLDTTPGGLSLAVANQSIQDFLNLARVAWALRMTEPSASHHYIDFAIPQVVYDSGTKIDPTNDWPIQHLVGVMEKPASSDNKATFVTAVVANGAAGAFTG